jgi:sn-glycerol 3-phosphate transport system substrate-binding protein
MQRSLALCVLALALALVIAACGAPSQPSAQQAPAQQAPTQQAAAQTQATRPAGTMEVEFWTLLTGNLAKELDNLVNDFNASQSEVKVTNVNQGGYPQLQQKLLASMAAGNPPVMTMVDYIYVPYYAQQGVFASINELASEADMKDFVPQLLADLTYQGKVYALPLNRSTQGLYYNKDLFKEVGLNPEAGPKDWTEFREFSKKLTNPDKKQFGAYATVPRWYWGPFVWENGGELSDDDCNVKFQEQPGIETAQYLQDLVWKDKTNIVPANLSGTFDQQAVEFIQSKVGMMRQSTAIQSFIGGSVKFNWAFSGMPAGPKARVVSGGGANVAISAKAKRRKHHG